MPSSLKIYENHDLSLYNTMGVSANARFFAEVDTEDKLRGVLAFAEEKELRVLVLGGGSNILFVGDFSGLVIHQTSKGIDVVLENDELVEIRVAAGENWHQLVQFCVTKGWGGIENLALIPGNVGAAPIQNIGAYGVELVNVFSRLDALFVETGDIKTFTKEECGFGYRDSVFKRELKGRIVIMSVNLILQKKPSVQLSYKALSDYLEKNGIADPGIEEVSKAVTAIRQSKLPDPHEIGNTGSFFKNPVIPIPVFNNLKEKYPGLPAYPVSEEQVKVPAGWLIEKAGWKGKREGEVGMHAKQALVLVNYGKATGQELWEFANKVKKSVYQQFDISLIPEVNIVN